MENPSAEAENETLAAAPAARERKKEKFVEQQLQWADGERGGALLLLLLVVVGLPLVRFKWGLRLERTLYSCRIVPAANSKKYFSYYTIQ